MTLSATLLLGALALSSPEPGTPQAGVDSVRAVRPTASLTVQSDIDSAIVVLDSHPAGRTPLVIDTLTPGTHVVRVIDPDATNWLAAVASDTIILNRGDERVLRYRLSSRISIDTRPSGARMLSGDSLIGITPLFLSTDIAQRGAPLLLVKSGYDSAVVRPDEAYRGILRVDLRPLLDPNPGLGRGVKPSIPPVSNALKISIAGGFTLVAGVAAAYMRIHADNLEAQYLITGDPWLLAQRDHYDTRSAVALVITQIGVGFLCYLLLSE